MKKLWLRVCSLLLVTVMMIQSLPVSAFATQADDSIPLTAEEFIPAEEFEMVEIQGENIEGRTEFSKEFLMENGLNLAVVYNSPVHFEENGQWEEIDNTLQVKSNGTYSNKAGVWNVQLPQQLTKNNQISITKDGYTLSFGMAGELRQQGNLEIMSTIPVEQQEVEEEALNTTVSEETTNTPTVEAGSVALETVIKQNITLQSSMEIENISSEETVTTETTPEETLPEETIPEETTPEVTVPEETVPEETIPEETIPEETIPEETIPEETIPEETRPEATVPEEVIPESTEAVIEVPEQDEPQPTATVLIDGVAQTFTVTSAQIANGQIQEIDRKALIAEADHPETILEKPFSQLMYENVYSNTDIRYDLIGNQVKESVILEAYSSTLRGYQFRLNTGELIPVLAEDGHIDFYDAQQKNIIMVMPAPYLFDADHVFCSDVRVNLSGNDGVYTLTYLLPQQWLAAADRAWPVVLDPVVQANSDVRNIQDKTIAEQYSPNYTYHISQVGVGSNYGAYQTYLQLNEIPSLGASDVILKATVSMKLYDSCTGTGVVEVHKVTEPWESAAPMTWITKPDFDTKVTDFVQLDSRQVYEWDITEIARSWYESDNTGVMFKVPDSVEGSSTASWIQFYSSDTFGENRPALLIYYRNNNGIESYWDYTTASAGRAGTAYINQHAGNMTWIHNDIGFGGNKMPVSINHVYNTHDAKSDTYSMGNGWRTNFNQKVYLDEDNTGYYVWEDGDGTSHYFYDLSSNTYKDEDGLELTLTTNGTGTDNKYKIVDKNGNASYFGTNGRLTKQENNQEDTSSITIEYSGDFIAKITDGAGRKYNFTYNSSNRLSKITYVGSGSTEISSISFAYTSGNLTSITYKDGKKANFTYGTNNLMTAATDVDGYKLKFAYDTMTAGKPNRIKTLSEHDGSDAGSELNFAYGHNQTILTDHNGNVQILQFNNWGNTVSIQDSEGRAQYARFANNDPQLQSSEKGNQLKLASKLQNTVKNYIINSNFEKPQDWTTTSNIVTAGNVSASSYLGTYAARIQTSAASSGAGIEKTYTVEANKTYTFSAYVKAVTASSYLKISKGSESVTSEVLPTNSDWTRLQVSYTPTTSGTATISWLTKDAGIVYMDCAQFEKAATASRYNLVENGDFSTTDYWTDANIVTVTDTAAPQLDGKVCKVTGNPSGNTRVKIDVNTKGNAGDVYVVAGWAKGYSVPLRTENGQTRRFDLTVAFMSGSDVVSTTHVAFNPCVDTWQYMADVAIAEDDYDRIKLQINYAYNCNTAYFDGIQLFKEEFGTSYTYDDNGNVTSVTDLQKQKTQYEYTNNNLTKEILPSGAELTYEYDDYHNVKEATTAEGLKYTFGYDDFGNNTSVSITDGTKTITSTATYENNGNTLATTTDAAGNKTTYKYNANTNVLEWVQYPGDSEQTQTNYDYDDEMYRMESATVTTNSGLSMSANYTYTDDLLTKLQTQSTAYTFTYGNFGLRSKIMIGSRTLASYDYTSRNNYLQTLAYGNGDSVNYTYDQQGRVTAQTYEDGDTVSYLYDNDGGLATVTDSGSGVTTTYYYDFIDRLSKYTSKSATDSLELSYSFDTKNNLTGITEVVNGDPRTTTINYDDDNRVTSLRKGGVSENYSYDDFGRLDEKTTKNNGTNKLTETFSYRANGSNTTSQVETLEIKTSNTSNPYKTYLYGYDDNGNITSVITDPNTPNSTTTTYTYDSANQLTREDNQAAGKTWTWTYDNAGNIKTRKEYDYTTGTLTGDPVTVNYTYGDNNWGDLLTNYDGQKVISDEIGNPLRGYGKSYTWEHGRQLAELGVDSDFAITKQPEYAEGILGDWLYFTVEAVGENLTYQWQASTNNGSTWSNSSVGGYNTPTMRMELRDYNNGYLYRCKVTDGNGNVVISEPVALVCVPIHITQQPVDFYGAVDDRVEFTVAADGTNLTYQWQVSANNGKTWTNSTAGGYATNNMWVTLSTSNSGKQYRCQITDGSGNVVYSEPGTIRTDLVAVTKQPEDCTAAYGERLSFTIEAYGENLSYQWQVSSNNGSSWSSTGASGNKTASMWVNMSESYVGYLYRCQVTDGNGNVVYSDPARAKASQVTWKYTYDADGMRTSRTNQETTYKYYYADGQLVRMKVNSTTMLFSYGADGSPVSVYYSGANYYYVTNVQGDVIAILNESGTAVVTYTYDAWGKLLTTTGSMATTLGKHNPLRYRGYVYDEEYGLYYLQSRYYNPEIGRFLNADIFISTGQGVLGTNMFAYCGNNPVIRCDNLGENYALCKADMVSPFSGFGIPSSYVYGGIGITVGALIGNAWDDIKETVSKSIAKVTTQKEYRSQTESHHIAAKQSRKAAEARSILEEIFPDGVENPLNKVDLKTSVHRRVHTNLYYATVNSLVVYAYNSAGADKEKATTNVINTLNSIRANLLMLNELAK